ncbi:MAG: APC family permease, partial [Candidatus Eremiobacteraeota bacterium]|nr:APC family permease [Candidatus Eremiobacteraeota bacterium]
MEQPAQLKSGSLGFVEVLAISIAGIGPSMTPLLIAPFMFANAGNGTWIAYVFGGAMMIFVAFNINQFARRSSAAGSMYGYVADNLGSTTGAFAGWSLLWAYGFVAASGLGSTSVFADQLLGLAGVHAPAAVIATLVAVAAWLLAYRGVQLSAIVMLVFEATSVVMICVLVGLILAAHGPSIDTNQLRATGGFPGGFGLAIGFAIFSFVGFESATAFGAEAKRPLVTIPRAVIGSVVFASAFFIVAMYAEIVGFAHAGKPLAQETFPLGTLVASYNLGFLRVPLLIGAFSAAFSVLLACITAAGRIAYAMASTNALPRVLAAVEPKHDTPNVAVTVVTAVTLAVALGSLFGGVSPLDIFNNTGTLSSFGFITIYGLISIAAFVFVKRRGEHRPIDLAVSIVALVLLVVPAVTLFYPVPAPPQRYFAYVYLAFLAAGWALFAMRRRGAATSAETP